MKTSAFKQLIKEAVKDAVREELQAIFTEESSNRGNISSLKENTVINFTSEDIGQVNDARALLRDRMSSAFGFNLNHGITENSLPNLSNNNTGPQVVAGENPYLAFLADAAQNMSPEERRGLRNM